LEPVFGHPQPTLGAAAMRARLDAMIWQLADDPMFRKQFYEFCEDLPDE